VRIEGFQHRMAAHCESGAVTSLLGHAGLRLSEPMVFGVAGGIFFGYFSTSMLPFPSFVLRNKPGTIWDNGGARLGASFRSASFKDPDQAEQALDALLARGLPVAVQVDFFYMDYVPAYARAHFNAHYAIVVGREGDEYLVSDAYAPQIARLHRRQLRLGRFARGQFAPKGLMLHLEQRPQEPDLPKAIRKGIKQSVRYMLRIPLPFMGARGIRYFAKKLPGWPQLARDEEHLSHEVSTIAVILEERGTGGGGFRFLYASFLQEAGRLLGNEALLGLAREMMANGDAWREISLFAARIAKRRDLGSARLEELAALLLERAEVEKDLFTRLGKAI